MLFKHEYQFIKLHDMLVGKFFFFLVMVMKNKFLTKRPRNRLPGIAIFCTFIALVSCMARGVLRHMLNCPVNFTHIYCTVPISRVLFSAIEKTDKLRTDGTALLKVHKHENFICADCGFLSKLSCAEDRSIFFSKLIVLESLYTISARYFGI